jgi:hypothetical protein
MAARRSTAEPSKKVIDMDTLLQNLRLSETEREVVVLLARERESLPQVKRMAVAKRLTVKKYSQQSLISTMLSAWSMTREVSFRPLAKNLFPVEAFCLGVWKRIMEEGPSIFRGCALMLEEYDGVTIFSSVEPCKVQHGFKSIRSHPCITRRGSCNN